MDLRDDWCLLMQEVGNFFNAGSFNAWSMQVQGFLAVLWTFISFCPSTKYVGMFFLRKPQLK